MSGTNGASRGEVTGVRVRRSRQRTLYRGVFVLLGALMVVSTGATSAWALAPDAPPAPTVVAGDAQITVTFSAPASDGGSPITAYNATCTSSDGGDAGSLANTGAVTPITVTGLTNGKSYTCTVDATNADGTSPESDPSSPSVVPAGFPSAPARPPVDRGNTQLTVTFNMPADNGSPITSYTATCTGGAFVPVSVKGPSSPIVVTGLTNGTTYKCRVKATNGVGTGPASPESLSVVPAAVPDAPPRPSVTRGIGQIVVRFARPLSHGTAITSYTATCTSSNGGTRRLQAGKSSPVTVKGVTNGRIYTCTVFATNGVGAGPPSPASVALIPGTAPAAPTLLYVVSARTRAPTGSLIVGFKPGSNNGTPISFFRVLCTPIKGGVEKLNTSTGTPITVPGLVTGSAYACSVSASSASGTSRSSTSLTTTVGTPGIPKGVTIASKSHGLTLHFTAPSNNGDAILHYHAVCKSTNGGAPANQFARGSPFGVNGLTPGGRYSCVLTAINGRGAGPSISAGPVRVPF
jgi:titin